MPDSNLLHAAESVACSRLQLLGAGCFCWVCCSYFESGASIWVCSRFKSVEIFVAPMQAIIYSRGRNRLKMAATDSTLLTDSSMLQLSVNVTLWEWVGFDDILSIFKSFFLLEFWHNFSSLKDLSTIRSCVHVCRTYCAYPYQSEEVVPPPGGCRPGSRKSAVASLMQTQALITESKQ